MMQMLHGGDNALLRNKRKGTILYRDDADAPWWR
jgi:hypothetical protein